MGFRQVEQTSETAIVERQPEQVSEQEIPGSQTAVSHHIPLGSHPNEQANNLAQMTNGRLSRASHTLLQLQNQYGNRYVQQLINPQQRLTVQPKLLLGDVDTPSEREADQIASRATNGQVTTPPTPVSGATMPVSPETEHAIEQARGGGQPLSQATQTQMSQVLGTDLSGVRVHTDDRANSLNQSLQAKAFTTGNDIFFRQGAYNPGSSGQQLLVHELSHVAQQSAHNLNHPYIQRFPIEFGYLDKDYHYQNIRIDDSVLDNPSFLESQDSDFLNALLGKLTKLISGIPANYQNSKFRKIMSHKTKVEALLFYHAVSDDNSVQMDALSEGSLSYSYGNLNGKPTFSIGTNSGDMSKQEVGNFIGSKPISAPQGNIATNELDTLDWKSYTATETDKMKWDQVKETYTPEGKHLVKNTETAKKMTDDELHAISHHIGAGYMSTNKRIGAYSFGDTPETRDLYYHRMLASGLNKLPPYEGTVYRGYKVDLTTQYDMAVGKTYTEKSIMSTSRSQKVGLGFGRSTTFVIEPSGGGKHVIELQIGAQIDEDEVLFPARTEMLITKMHTVLAPNTHEEVLAGKVPAVRTKFLNVSERKSTDSSRIKGHIIYLKEIPSSSFLGFKARDFENMQTGVSGQMYDTEMKQQADAQKRARLIAKMKQMQAILEKKPLPKVHKKKPLELRSPSQRELHSNLNSLLKKRPAERPKEAKPPLPNPIVEKMREILANNTYPTLTIKPSRNSQTQRRLQLMHEAYGDPTLRTLIINLLIESSADAKFAIGMALKSEPLLDWKRNKSLDDKTYKAVVSMIIANFIKEVREIVKSQ